MQKEYKCGSVELWKVRTMSPKKGKLLLDLNLKVCLNRERRRLELDLKACLDREGRNSIYKNIEVYT